MVDWSERAQRHAASLPHEQRKQHGVWFTPPALALPTARRALEPLLADAPGAALRVCDPAVGGGAFLLAALQAANELGDEVALQLVGRDVDAAAAALAATALRDAGAAATDIAHGDGLLDDSLQPGTFDCVLTNPPWETLQSGADAPARVRALRPRFAHQGNGKLYTYRLFVERALQLLRPGGRLGLVVPASLWFDRDAEPLRRLLLDECDWQWLFGFENRDKVFAIDSRYRFAVVLATKGGSTKNVRVAFGRTDLGEWAAPAPQHVRYRRDELRLLSPHSGAFVEAEHRRDLDVLRRMHEAGRALLGDAFSWESR